MRVWVSRTAPGALATAARVEALGHQALVAPVLGVRLLRPAIDVTGVATIALTSVHAVAAIAGTQASREIPVYAVGATTAEAARAAGFIHVVEAGPDALAVVSRIADERPQGVVLYPRAKETAHDLEAELAAPRIEVRPVIAYRTEPLAPSRDLAAALAGVAAPLNAVLIHSGRGAARVADLLAGAAMAAPLAVVVSIASAQPLQGARVREVRVAQVPDEQSMLDLLA